MNNLAIFDLDHTLINTDSDNAWPEFMIKKGLLDAEEAAERNRAFYRDYQNGCLDIREFTAFQTAPMKHLDSAELAALHQEFVHDFIRPCITAMAKQLVAGHRAAGDELLVISSTNEFIITPICHLFGIRNIIGTQLETDAAGRYTGGIVGTPSLKEGKITRLQEWLAARGESLQSYGRSYFYSDSHNDLPLLQYVSDPVAVNPDALLAEHARQHGWPILNFV